MPSRRSTVARLILEARPRKSWRQDDLEAASGVSCRTISRWESGLVERPDPEPVQAVCRALGINTLKAAVALGYISADDLNPVAEPEPVDPTIEEVIDILQDPQVAADDKDRWVDFLRYLRTKGAASTKRPAFGGTRAS